MVQNWNISTSHSILNFLKNKPIWPESSYTFPYIIDKVSDPSRTIHDTLEPFWDFLEPLLDSLSIYLIQNSYSIDAKLLSVWSNGFGYM
jgi:hypothetical protein